MTLPQTMFLYGLSWSLADIIEQRYVSKKANHDFKKTLRIMTVGTCVMSPMVFTWLRIVRRLSPGTHLISIARRVVIDQTAYVPFMLSTFFASTCFLEGKSIEEFKEEWKIKFPQTYLNNLKLWPMVQLVNFKYVPLIHQPKVIISVSFGWAIYLCYQKENKTPIEANAS